MLEDISLIFNTLCDSGKHFNSYKGWSYVMDDIKQVTQSNFDIHVLGYTSDVAWAPFLSSLVKNHASILYILCWLYEMFQFCKRYKGM